MSLFLGKIHYWLFQKVLWFENLEGEMVAWAKVKELPVEEWMKEIYGKYGAPTAIRPLEELIDTSNIHGWLQDRIHKAEGRHAAWVTRIVNANKNYKQDLMQLSEEQGAAAAGQYEGNISRPEDAYTALNEFILEGMPCDRVDAVISNTSDEYVWHTTQCLHKTYWDTERGDVQNFHDLREAWIKAFIHGLHPGFRYEQSEHDVHRIIRQ